MPKTQTIIDPSHELMAVPELPELEASYDYPELSGYEGYLMELETTLKRHEKVSA